MISGRIGFIAGMVGLGLTGRRIDQRSHSHRHPAPPEPTTPDIANAAPPRPERRYRLLTLLKGTTL